MDEEKDRQENEYLSEQREEITETTEAEEEYAAEESVEQKIKKLKERLYECEKEKKGYLDGWQRARADSINARKEQEKAREEIINYKTGNILKEFLVVADAFEQATKNGNFDALDENYQKGIEAIRGKLMQVLESHNVLPFSSEGEKFNPERHEALVAEDVDDAEKDHIVLHELQNGYTINNKILRPAKVKVGIYKKLNN